MITDVKRLLSEFDGITEYWSPRIIGQANDQYIKLAKLKGEFIWHDHAAEDELFFVVKGRLEIRYRDRSVMLQEGDLHVTPKGIEHCPVAEDECWVMLIEPISTLHTGDVADPRARSIKEQLADSGLTAKGG